VKAWSVALVCIIIVLCVTAIELYALHLGIDGVALAGAIAAIVGVPAVLITRKVVKKE
jgi:hypothetical protein